MARYLWEEQDSMGPSNGYFDPNQAAQYAKTAPALPPTWVKLPLLRRAVITEVVVGFIGGILLVVAGIALFTTNTVFVPIGGDALGQGVTGLIIQLLEILLCIAIGIALFVYGILRMVRLSHLSDFFFLVTPEGFAQVSGNKVVGLPISDVVKVTRYNNRGNISLIIARRSGKALRINGINGYGKQANIAALIVSAMNMARSAAVRAPQAPQQPYPQQYPQQYPPQQYPGSPYQPR